MSGWPDSAAGVWLSYCEALLHELLTDREAAAEALSPTRADGPFLILMAGLASASHSGLWLALERPDLARAVLDSYNAGLVASGGAAVQRPTNAELLIERLEKAGRG